MDESRDAHVWHIRAGVLEQSAVENMATVYVATTGNDSYTYAQAQNPATPWLTPGKAVSTAVNGDTVSVGAGTFTFNTQNFETKTLTFVGAALANGVPTTIFDGGSLTAYWRIGHSANLTITNIYLKNIYAVSGTPIFNVSFESGGTGSGIFTFTNCRAENVRMDGNAETGGFVGTTGANSYTATFVGCVLQLQRKASPSGSVAAVTTGRSRTETWTNCVVYTDSSGADDLTALFATNGGTPTRTIKNCIFMSAGASIAFESGTHSNTATYGDFYQLSGSPSGTGVITSDPKFIDPTNGNFRLRQDSPCLNAGVNP